MPFDERMLNGMGVLSAIVDSGSFASASETLGMSQSGVSRSVARLEARLGIRLFDRTTRSVTLTDEGRRFYEQIVPLLERLGGRRPGICFLARLARYCQVPHAPGNDFLQCRGLIGGAKSGFLFFTKSYRVRRALGVESGRPA